MTEMVHSLAVIVLAAGRSSRMGRAKQLEVVDGEAMVVRAARLALGCEAAVTTVITGAYAEQVEQQLAQLIQTQGLQLVHNPNWAEGQATSVHAAIQSLPATIEAALFLPVDQPFVTPGFLQSVIDCWQGGAELVAPKVDGEARGAPAIFARKYFPELLQIQGDVGGRVVLMKHKNEVTWLAADAKMLRDIDTPEDVEAEIEVQQKSGKKATKISMDSPMDRLKNLQKEEEELLVKLGEYTARERPPSNKELIQILLGGFIPEKYVSLIFDGSPKIKFSVAVFITAIILVSVIGILANIGQILQAFGPYFMPQSSVSENPNNVVATNTPVLATPTEPQAPLAIVLTPVQMTETATQIAGTQQPRTSTSTIILTPTAIPIANTLTATLTPIANTPTPTLSSVIKTPVTHLISDTIKMVQITDNLWMDQYETTNAQYSECVTAEICTPPQNPNSHTRLNYFYEQKYADYPVINITWQQAQKYCEFRGKRLPTDQEWIFAATGCNIGDDRSCLTKHPYPWQENGPDCSKANFFNSGQYCADGEDTASVGHYSDGTDRTTGASPFGIIDMAGNVWEWTHSCLDKNCENIIIRGGDWGSTIEQKSVNLQNIISFAANTTQGGGIRCIR